MTAWSWDFGDGSISSEQSPSHSYVAEGSYTVSLTVGDADGNTDTSSRLVQIPAPRSGGDWVGIVGADGYALGAWGGGSDLVSLVPGSLSVDQALRHRWSDDTADVRALEAPDGSHRRAGAWYHASAVRLSVTFDADYVGPLNVYSLDWDSDERRQTVTVDDGSGPLSVVLAESFNGGVWSSFDIDVVAGSTVTVVASNDSGPNAVISALTLG